MWTMARGWSRPGVVLVVTSRRDRLRPIAELIADAGLHGIAATPYAIGEVFEVATPDLVVLLADLPSLARARVARRHATEPRQRGVVIHVVPPSIDLIEVVNERLPPDFAGARAARAP